MIAIPRIDWRREFRQLDPMLRKGGIVRISYAGDICAWPRFDTALKQAVADLPGASFSIRIDSHWHKTRYLADILGEFDRKLAEAGLPPAPVPCTAGAATILSDNDIGGHAELRIDVLHLHGNGDAERASRRDAAVTGVCDRLRTLLARGDRAVVVLHHAAKSEQAAFWGDLWRRGLSSLIDEGLLFVQYVDDTDARGTVPDMPDPHLHLTLPPDFADEARESDAYDDLIDLFTGLGIHPERASGLATSHLNSNAKSMLDFYNNLAPLLMKLRIAEKAAS